jgi:beta-glucanase (GH16 family)
MNAMKKLMLILGVCGLLWTACDGPEPVDVNMFVEGTARFEGETNSTFSFRVRIDQASEVEVTVQVETSEVFEGATAGDDFIAKSETVTIPVGATEASFEVEVIGDDVWEYDENFEVVLSNATNAVITGEKAVGTIRNDDQYQPIGDAGYTTPTSYPGMTLVWADEFDGAALNTNDWNYETGASGWGNNELQYYKSGEDNAYVNNGKLVIEARDESFGGAGYTSARITTQNKQSFKYGRIDIRAQLPEGQGIWPALWMLGDAFATSGWPSCGEIDIMELIGHQPSTVYGTVHWSTGSGSHAEFGGSRSLTSGKFIDEFHVFSIVWDSNSIRWYLDDNQYHVIDITPADLNEFQEKFFFIFNVAVGGNWPGNPDATTVFPQRMIVDYVRVFQ